MAVLLQDASVGSLIENLGDVSLEKRQAAETELSQRLSKGEGDRALFRVLSDAERRADAETAVRLRKIMAPWKSGGIVWERDLGAPIEQVLQATDARVVVVTRHNVRPRCYPCTLKVRALSPKTGKDLWEGSEPFGQNPAQGVVVGDLWIATNSMELRAFDLVTGRLAWSVKSRHSFAEPVVDGGRVFVGGYGWFTCFDRATGRELWVVKDRGWHVPPLMAGELLITGAGNSGLKALRKADGAIAWENDFRGNPRWVDGDVVIGDGFSTAWSRRISDGSPVWEWKHSKGKVAGIHARAGRRLVMVCHRERLPKDATRSSMDAYDFSLSVLDLDSGRELWSADLGDDPARVTVTEGTVVVGEAAYGIDSGEKVPAPPPAPPVSGLRAAGLEFRSDPLKDDDVTAGSVLRALRVKGLED